MNALPSLGLLLAAWLAAVACALLSAWHVRGLALLAPPSREELRARLRGTTDRARLAVLEELREAQSDAERKLSLATLWPRSLARISLASGTALAVTSLARGLGARLTHLPGGVLEFSAGFVGMMVCAALGRQAKATAAKLRQEWRDRARSLARE